MSIDLSSPSARALRRAADIKETIEKLGKELNSLIGGSAPPLPKRRKMSAAARAKISAAAKARWAKVKATKPAAKAVKPVKKKFKMSAAAKAKLSALAKARWAKVKNAGRKKL
jgi:hypothetical protein